MAVKLQMSMAQTRGSLVSRGVFSRPARVTSEGPTPWTVYKTLTKRTGPRGRIKMWFPTNLQKAAGMDRSNRKALVLVSMLLLTQLACDAHSVSECCSQPSRSCRLYVLLCRPGSRGIGGTLIGDASLGILTLGKRGEDEHRLQGRLHQLLHGSKNQAAGILTMGKRTGERAGQQYLDWMAQAGSTIMTPLPD